MQIKAEPSAKQTHTHNKIAIKSHSKCWNYSNIWNFFLARSDVWLWGHTLSIDYSIAREIFHWTEKKSEIINTTSTTSNAILSTNSCLPSGYNSNVQTYRNTIDYYYSVQKVHAKEKKTTKIVQIKKLQTNDWAESEFFLFLFFFFEMVHAY